jgi:hypothetical protein
MKPTAPKGPASFPGTHLVASLNKSERRSSLRLYKHWDAARGQAALPKLPDFDMSLLEELGDHCFLLVVGQGEGQPAFRHFGRELAGQIGRDLTGCAISDAPSPSLLARVLGHYVEATQRRKPVGVSGRFEHGIAGDLLYRGILLPFSSEPGRVDAVLGCYRSRPESPSARRDQSHSAAPATIIGPDELVRRLRPTTMHGVRTLARKVTWPERALSRARSAPALGRAVARLDEPSREFALLLVRRVEGQSDRFEVVSATGPVLLNLALRQAAMRLLRLRA